MTIKEFRQSQGLSQPKLAKALGIGVSTVGGYETGKIKPSAKVIAKIREVFGVDLGAAAPAAVEAAPAPEAAPVAEKKAAPAKKAKKEEAAPAPAKKASKAKKEETAPAKKANKAKKEETAPASAKKTSKAKKAATVAVEEKKEAAPTKTSKPKKATSSKQTAIVIQSPMGGEITTEDILAKVGDVDTVYVRVDQNAIYWIKGEKSGAVNIW